MPGSLPPSARTEAEARLELAAACRLMARFGMADLTSAHLSTTLPERPGHCLPNPYGMIMEEVTASSLVEMMPMGGREWPGLFRLPDRTGAGSRG